MSQLCLNVHLECLPYHPHYCNIAMWTCFRVWFVHVLLVVFHEVLKYFKPIFMVNRPIIALSSIISTSDKTTASYESDWKLCSVGCICKNNRSWLWTTLIVYLSILYWGFSALMSQGYVNSYKSQDSTSFLSFLFSLGGLSVRPWRCRCWSLALSARTISHEYRTRSKFLAIFFFFILKDSSQTFYSGTDAVQIILPSFQNSKKLFDQ